MPTNWWTGWADFLENIESFSVKSPVTPGEIIAQLPEEIDVAHVFANNDGFSAHHCAGNDALATSQFHAYFPANSSPPSVLAEMLHRNARCPMHDLANLARRRRAGRTDDALVAAK
ncbi:MAG: hypothetical protein R3C26_04860 [Calditrichia bacterium]